MTDQPANNIIVIIGGGAAGMMAAIIAARKGAQVILLEKMNKPGRKLSITGKGRCNITNTDSLREFLTHIDPDPNFLFNIFSRFFSKDIIDFFQQLGINTIEERGGRIFPENVSAMEIVNTLVKEMQRLGVKIILGAPVKQIICTNRNIKGVRLENGTFIKSHKIILATGGSSYPATGSTGDGYKLAAELGHHIRTPVPALVPIDVAGRVAPTLRGLTLKNIKATVYNNGKIIADEFCEMLFTHFGLSWPIILSLSRKLNRIDFKNNKVDISLDLKPALDEKTLDHRLLRDFTQHGKMQAKTILKGLLPSSLIPVCLDLLQIEAKKPAHQITAEERKKLRLWLKDFRFQITGIRGFKEAIITSGGVSTLEINPKTLESKLVSGLFFAGEIIDLDADTGGYNLQIAFSTGWIAGESAAIQNVDE